MFVRLLRVKTSEVQGLSIFPDENFLTCPLTILSVALVMQIIPSASLLNHLPTSIAPVNASLPESLSLADILNGFSQGGEQENGNL